LRRLGARRVSVLPFFLFPGVLPERIAAQSAAAAARLGMDVAVAGLIGDCDGLADLVLERYAEAAGGPVFANCDACVYRVAMPGFEHRVGAAQLPHDHPDDPSHQHGGAVSGAYPREGAHSHPHAQPHDPAHAPVHSPAPVRSGPGRDSAESRHAGSPSVR
jgi:sirohydrochlorin cobaltochelatase